MDYTGADRQYRYRTQHPQINVTFRNVEEYRSIKKASIRTGRTPREVLLTWAQQVLVERKSSGSVDEVRTPEKQVNRG